MLEYDKPTLNLQTIKEKDERKYMVSVYADWHLREQTYHIFSFIDPRRIAIPDWDRDGTRMLRGPPTPRPDETLPEAIVVHTSPMTEKEMREFIRPYIVEQNFALDSRIDTEHVACHHTTKGLEQRLQDPACDPLRVPLFEVKYEEGRQVLRLGAIKREYGKMVLGVEMEQQPHIAALTRRELRDIYIDALLSAMHPEKEQPAIREILTTASAQQCYEPVLILEKE
jgi:hypothetical protein